MHRSYKFKASLNATARRNVEWQLARLAELHNAAVEERRDAWKMCRKSIRFFDQVRQLKDIKRDRPEYAKLGSQVLENCLKRVDLAFQAFYRRVRAGQTPGYPRFKSARRYDSLTFRQGCGWKLDGRRLAMQGIGSAKVFLSRPVAGTIKTVTLRRDACGDWWVTFSCEDVPAEPLPATGQSVGVDVGLSHFATLSTGDAIENPRPARIAEVRVRHAQRGVSKRKRGSNRQRKAGRVVARHHRRVANVRRDFHWKLARKLVERYDRIAVEDLNVAGLAGGMLAKSVHDAAWGDFLHALASEAEKAGRELVVVDPRGTSQQCSGCGATVSKTLAERTHTCSCGLVLDRDHNAALNILARGIAQAERAASRLASSAAA
jgi:putative transposase